MHPLCKNFNKCNGVCNRCTSVDTVSSADAMRAIAKIISLIDTVRYRNWLRRLVLIYIGFVGGFPRRTNGMSASVFSLEATWCWIS
jgi:hypothetical protein